MLEVYERLSGDQAGLATVRLVLDHDQREKGRLRTLSSEGEEVRLFLERGAPLRVGEALRSRCGRTLVVEGAEEDVVVAACDDWPMFSRACYHLGNRHVKVEIGARWLRIKPDHVLEEMLVLQGLTLTRERAVFVPETGAYSRGHHNH